MMYIQAKISLGICVLSIAAMVGCASNSNSTASHSRQAEYWIWHCYWDKRISTGSKGKVDDQRIDPKSNKGQVRHIEGAAYILSTQNNTEIRLPFDENTRIDRPAHVGDWVEAYTDQGGRARVIRNVDDQISLE